VVWIPYPIHALQISAMGVVCADSLQFEELVRVFDGKDAGSTWSSPFRCVFLEGRARTSTPLQSLSLFLI
jgi:hypothetical protein